MSTRSKEQTGSFRMPNVALCNRRDEPKRASGFGIMKSERRPRFAAGVPECDDLNETASYSIVEKVSNSGEIQAANDIGASDLDLGADTRLFYE